MENIKSEYIRANYELMKLRDGYEYRLLDTNVPPHIRHAWIMPVHLNVFRFICFPTHSPRSRRPLRQDRRCRRPCSLPHTFLIPPPSSSSRCAEKIEGRRCFRCSRSLHLVDRLLLGFSSFVFFPCFISCFSSMVIFWPPSSRWHT